MTQADAATSTVCFGRGKSPAVSLNIAGNGAAFVPLPLPPNTTAPACSSLGFSVSFSFLVAPQLIYNGQGYTRYTTEGFTVALVTTPAMGAGGNQLGYGGLNGLAVEFDSRHDSFDPVLNHVGIDVGGSLASLATFPMPYNLDAQWGSLLHAEIQYDPATQLLSVLFHMDGQSASGAILTRYMDLCSALGLQTSTGTPTLYVGFTGGSSEPVYPGKYMIHDWQVSTGED